MLWLMTGCWVRAWIEFADGTRDDTSVVAWLQLPSLMADVRLPGATAAGVDPTRRSLADCTLAELRSIADSESSSGYTTCTTVEEGPDGVRRATAEWHTRGHGTAFQPVSAFPEPGLLEWNGDGTVMIERAPSGAYVEEWRLVPGSRSDQSHQRLDDRTELFVAGPVVVLVRDRAVPVTGLARLPELIDATLADPALAPDEARMRIEQLVDCEFSFARRRGSDGGQYVIEASTLPWRLGEVIDVDLR
jgi:hypothetical protein